MSDTNTNTTQQAVSKALSTRAVLIHLSIRAWNAKKTDDDAGDLISAQYGSDRDRVEAKKHLVDPNILKPCREAAQKARAFNAKYSVPWLDEGIRLIPAKSLDKHCEKLRELRSNWETEVNALRNVLPAALEEGKKKLGGLAKEEDYLTVEEALAKFGFDFTITTVPDKRDIRVELSNEGAKMVQESIDKSVKTANESIVRETTSRVAAVVGKLTSTLKEKKKGDDKEYKIFRDSLVGNCIDLVGVLRELNIMEDASLEKLATDLESVVKDIAPSEIRESEEVRTKVVSAADDILARMSAGGYAAAAYRS